MRQKDFTIRRCSRRLLNMSVALQCISKRYLHRKQRPSSFSCTQSLLFLASKWIQKKRQTELLVDRSHRIAATDFRFNFNRFSDHEALLLFRFRVHDVMRLAQVIGWPQSRTHTTRNRYKCDAVLVTCVILRRLAVPDRWSDLELLFGEHGSQLSEIFWEGIEQFVEERGHLLLAEIPQAYVQERAETWAGAIAEKCGTMDNCIGFIDGTVVGVARPTGHMLQLVVYNGHKRKHALKYQAVNTPDGIILHAHGPTEGRRHDWFLDVCSGLDSNLDEVLNIDEKQYVLYGDSGYNWRQFIDIPFEGSNLTANQKAFNTSMSRVRITVEWIFKEVKCYFSIVDMKRKMKICESPVGLLYIATMLLCNLRNCIYPNQISKYFACAPPSLEEYISQR